MPTLVYWDSDGVERLHELGDQPVMIGRSSECGIRSEDTRVSRRHARITSDGRDCWIEDMGSANGVYVGQRRVEQAQIPPGEIVVVGSFLLQLQAMDGKPAVPSPGAHAQLSVWLKMERESRAAVMEERGALAARVSELSAKARDRTHASETTEDLSRQVEDVRAELEAAKLRELERYRAKAEADKRREVERAVDRAIERTRSELEVRFDRERKELTREIESRLEKEIESRVSQRHDTDHNPDLERELDELARDYDAAGQRIEKLENELAARDLRAKDERRAEAELRQHADNLAAEVERLRAEAEDLAALEAENSQLMERQRKLEGVLSRTRESADAGQAAAEQNQALRGDIADLEIELESAREAARGAARSEHRAAALESENQSLAGKLNQATVSLDEVRQELEELAEAFNEIGDERDELTAKLHQLRTEDDAAHSQMAVLQRDQQKLTKERDAVATQLQAATEAAETAQKEAQDRLLDLQKEKYKVSQERDKLSKENEKLAREVEFLRNVDGGSQLSSEDIDAFESQRRQLQDKLDAAVAHRDQLREQAESLGLWQKEAIADLEALADERDELAERLEAVHESVAADAQDELAALREDNARMRREKDDLAAKLELLRDDANADVAEAGRRAETLESELAELREQAQAVPELEARAAEAAEAAERVSALEAQLAELRDQAQAQAELEERAAEGSEAAERVSALEAQLAELRDQVEELPELRAEAAQVPELRARLAELEDELQANGNGAAGEPAGPPDDTGSLRGQLDELKDQMDELRDRLGEERTLRREAEERTVELQERAESLERDLEKLAEKEAPPPPPSPEGSGEIPGEITDHVISLVECVAALRANMRAASDETAIMPPEDESTQVLTAAVSDAVEQIERARDSLRVLGTILDID